MAVLIARLDADEQLRLILKLLHSIPCRFCGAERYFRCDVNAGTREDLFRNGDEYWAVHQLRMDDAMPMYEAEVAVRLAAQKDEIRQRMREQYEGSDKQYSDFYEPAGPEINVDCDYCDVEAGHECVTIYGLLTKSHRPRKDKYKRMNPMPTIEERNACPTCKAQPGRKCRTESGKPANKPHVARKNRV